MCTNVQSLVSSVNADLLSVATYALKLNLAVNKSEQGIIGASANIVSGVNVSAALSYKNVARKDKLSIRALNAKSFGLGVTSVLGRTHSLFMSELL